MQDALLRGMSGHYPIMLIVDEDNWGSKPICMLKSWAVMHDTSIRCGGYVLKEKLKLIKSRLKV